MQSIPRSARDAKTSQSPESTQDACRPSADWVSGELREVASFWAGLVADTPEWRTQGIIRAAFLRYGINDELAVSHIDVGSPDWYAFLLCVIALAERRWKPPVEPVLPAPEPTRAGFIKPVRDADLDVYQSPFTASSTPEPAEPNRCRTSAPTHWLACHYRAGCEPESESSLAAPPTDSSPEKGSA